MDKKENTVISYNGNKIALIRDVRYKSRRGIDWNEVERYLRRYIGQCYVITETLERIYIGSDFPDEFSHSNDTKGLKGANIKNKANLSSAIEALIQVAMNKAEYPDYAGRHGAKAKGGWYRYDTRFSLPVYGDGGILEKYNIFTARMLVRCDANGLLYLYDFVRTKKETSIPLEQ